LNGSVAEASGRERGDPRDETDQRELVDRLHPERVRQGSETERLGLLGGAVDAERVRAEGREQGPGGHRGQTRAELAIRRAVDGAQRDDQRHAEQNE
jgi:hypothetical protein